jgi:hypothetical protein
MKHILIITTAAAFALPQLQAQNDAGALPPPPRPPGAHQQPPPHPLPPSPRPPHAGRASIGKPGAFLGVSTSPLPPVLAAQLSLPEGFGLVVDEVLPESPAAAAGVQRHDILKLLNDQQLIDPDQLSTLVRSLGKDTRATLTIIRAGKEQKLEVTLAERMFPERRPVFHPLHPELDKLRLRLPEIRERAQDAARRLQEKSRDLQTEMQQLQEKFRDWQKEPAGAPAPKPPGNTVEPTRDVGNVFKELQHRGVALGEAVRDAVRVDTEAGEPRVLLRDSEGEIEVKIEKGKRVLTARDAQGKQTFSGPIESEAERDALPEPLRKKLETVNVTTSDKPIPVTPPPVIELEAPDVQ